MKPRNSAPNTSKVKKTAEFLGQAVGATAAVGLLALAGTRLNADYNSEETPRTDGTTITVEKPPTPASSTTMPEVGIGEAVTQDRNVDGTPGPVVVRTGDTPSPQEANVSVPGTPDDQQFSIQREGQ